MTKVALLCGGVGGAKLAVGLHLTLGSGQLGVVVNTGDDFEHLGLRISPDIDTVIYTLAGLANPMTGWGRHDEQWACMAALEQLGGDSWFRLGDRDLAMHLKRTAALARGETLTAVTGEVAGRLGLSSHILPMSDDRVSTIIESDQGLLGFQHYFVKAQCRPRVSGITFAGSDMARPTPQVLSLLADEELQAIILAPSNPFLSLDPILSVPGLRTALRTAPARVIAVSPLIGGRAFKGPTAKIMGELGFAVSAAEVAARYRDILDGFIVDRRDEAALDAVRACGVAVRQTDITMDTLDEKRALASDALAFARELQGKDAC